jgi:hypothetical protein
LLCSDLIWALINQFFFLTPLRRVETSMKIARRAGIVLGSVSAVAVTMAAGAPVHAAQAPQWQITNKVHYGPTNNASGYSVVVAPAADDAWVFGGTNPGGTSTPAAEHWNGTRWQRWTLPTGLSGFIVAADASSPDNIWAVGDGYALRWNGVKWTVANTWSQGGEATSVAVVNPTDVWVFGSSEFTGTTGLGTWHYNGRAWIRASGVAAAVYRASAVSRHNIWGITASGVVHYNGHAWTPVPSAAPVLGNAQPGDILAVARSIWVSGIAPANGTQGRLVLAHWNSKRWTRFTAPWKVQQSERFAPDGAGGIWIPVVTGGASPATWILHLSRTGSWTRTRIAAGPGAGVGVGDLALVPGTTTLWGIGGLLTTTGGDAAIWEHGAVRGRLAAHDRRAGRRPAAPHSHGLAEEQVTVAAHGGVIHVYLTSGSREVIRVYLAIRNCRSSGPAPARTGPARIPAGALTADDRRSVKAYVSATEQNPRLPH